MNLNIEIADDSSVEEGPVPSPSSPLQPVAIKLEPGVAATDVESIVLDISREGSINNEDPIDLTFSPPSPTSPPRRRPGHQLNATPATGAIVAFDPISTPAATMIGSFHPRDGILTPIEEVAAASSKPPTDRPKKKQKNNSTPGPPAEPAFVEVKRKRKRLGMRQLSINFSPTSRNGVKSDLKSKSKSTPNLEVIEQKQNTLDQCCNCTERSTCADKKCACVKRAAKCTNCKCSDKCVNILVPSPSTSKSKSTSKGWDSIAAKATSFTDIQKEQSNPKKSVSDKSRSTEQPPSTRTKQPPPALSSSKPPASSSSKGQNKSASVKTSTTIIRNPYLKPRAQQQEKKPTGMSNNNKNNRNKKPKNSCLSGLDDAKNKSYC